MTPAEALESLGLPEGSDWSRVQAAYHRLAARASERARAGDPNAGLARLEEAFQSLRRQMLLGAGRPEPPPRAAVTEGPPRQRPARSPLVPALLLAGVAALGWWTVTQRRQPAPKPEPVRPVLVQPPVLAHETQAGAINYSVLFARDTAVMSQEGPGLLARVADTMHYYPLDNINLVGYADRTEPASESLAELRAKAVAAVLVEKYNVQADRVRVSGKVVDFPASKVEVYIVEGAP